MREILIGKNKQRVVASPITLYFYKKEFGRDLIGDLMIFQKMETDASSFDSIVILQMAWAMIKTAKMGSLESFDQWIAGLDCVYFDDPEMLTGILEESAEGFFC